MEEEKKALINELSNLGENLKEAVPINLEKEKPRIISLNEYERLMIDAIKWREESARAYLKLGQKELDEVSRMKEDLFLRCKVQYGIPDEVEYKLDVGSKTLKIN